MLGLTMALKDGLGIGTGLSEGYEAGLGTWPDIDQMRTQIQ